MWRERLAAAVLVAFASACSVIPASRFVERYGDPTPEPQHLTLCQGYSCRFGITVALTSSEWAEITGMLDPPAANPATERERVGLAVARLDLLAGQHAGTAVTQRRDWINRGDPSQLDCVDKTVNTTTFLTLFDHAKLLRWHRPGTPAHRGTILNWDVANTAVLIENSTDHQYSVDTALGDPGLPPYIVPIEIWLKGPLPEFRHNPALRQAGR